MVGVGWDGFLKAIKYRRQDGVGVGRISDSTKRVEITPDGSTQHPNERTDRDNDRRLDSVSVFIPVWAAICQKPAPPHPGGRGGGVEWGWGGGLGRISVNRSYNDRRLDCGVGLCVHL